MKSKSIIWITLLCIFAAACAQAATPITTRAAAGRSLSWAEMDGNFTNLRDALDSSITSTGSAISALQSSQTAGAIGFQNVAAMTLGYAAGTTAVVTNDPTASNNTYWIKLGASGSGSWQKSAISPFLPYYSSRQFSTVAQAIAAIGSVTPSVLRVSTTLTVANGDTFPDNISVIVENGGLFSGSGSPSLTFNGPFDAGNHQAFTGLGTLSGSGLKQARPEWFAVNTTPGTTDMTAALRAACAAVPFGEVVLSASYRVDTTSGGPINLSIYQRLRGTVRSTSIVTNASTTNYTFQYLSTIGTAGTYGPDIDAGLVVENLTINAKYGIKLNSRGTYASVFQPQATLKNIRITGNTFIGNYFASNDPNINTTNYPAVNADGSDNELLAYGCAIDAAKVFDSTIQNNLIQDNGVGMYLDGCDINNLTTNRFHANARHIHIFSHNTYGFQNKIENNDMLGNYRRGAVYDTASFTSIKDNYFETYTPAAEYITQRGGAGTLIWGNRFDNSAQTTPIISLAPLYGVLVSANRTNPSTPVAPIEVLSTNYQASVVGTDNNYFVKFFGNSGSFTATKFPWCEYDFNNPRVFDAYNPKHIAGVVAATFPFKTSLTSGKQVIKTDTSTLFVYLETKPTDSVLTLKAAGTYVSGAGFINVTWGGTSAYSGYFGFTAGGVQVKSVTITKPAGVTPDSGLTIELVNNQVEYQGLEII